MAHTAAHLYAVILVVSVWRVGIRYKNSRPPNFTSLISLNGFCGRKAPCFLPVGLATRGEVLNE